MPISSFLEKAERFEIQAYRKPRNLLDLRKTHVPYAGSPLKHPHDSQMVILVSDPGGPNPLYLEFRAGDISYMEELPNLVTLEGESILMARIWVKKGSLGIRCTPFLVEDLRERGPQVLT
jgi:inorganic pyrophosphatase